MSTRVEIHGWVEVATDDPTDAELQVDQMILENTLRGSLTIEADHSRGGDPWAPTTT